MQPGRKLFLRDLTSLHRELGMTVYSKDKKWTKLWVIIDRILRILTFGKMTTFLTGFTTTLGKKVFFPAGWDVKSAGSKDYEILRHEARHVHQFLTLGLGNEYLGILIMGILYLLIPLPIGFAWFRYYFEREAYVESYYASCRSGYQPDIEDYVELLTGPKYLWTWYSKDQVRRYFKRECR